MLVKTKEITKFEKYFLFVLFFELFAGGGGRFIEIGPLSIRQVLFIGVLFIFGCRFILNKDSRKELLSYFIKPNTAIFWLSIAMVVWIGASALLGIMNHHGLGMIVTDSLRVIFVILIIPFVYYIDEKRFSVKNLVSVLLSAALVVSVITISIAIISKFMTDSQFFYFYKDVNAVFPGDLFFRPSRGVFYKSHFLVLFSLIITTIKLMEKQLTKFQGLVLILGIVSIVLSETRGLYLGYLVGLFTYVLTKIVIYFWGKRQSLVLTKKNNLWRVVILVIAIFGTFYFYTNSTISRFSEPESGGVTQGEYKEEQPVDDVSMNVRLVLFKDSIQIIKTSRVGAIIGNGYGMKIGDRITGIEMSFIDIYVEQGLIGTLIWLIYALLPLYYYFRSFLALKKLDNIHIALLSCTLAMLLVTNINPFLNGPIGLSFLLPVIVASYKLFRDSKNEEDA